MIKYLSISLLLFLIPDMSLGQIPIVKTPQRSTISNGTIINTNPHNKNIPNIPASPISNNPSNRQQLDMYERDRLEVERMQMERQRQIVESYINNPDFQYDLPSWSDTQGTEHYYQTARNLLDMLNGKTPLNLKEAVFSVENAYFEGQLDLENYDGLIKQMVDIARLKSIQDGYNWNNPETKNIMLYRVMSDTLTFKFPLHEKKSVSFPMQYDFDDFKGEKDYSKLFVTKLLSAHKGQCHSLPLLYLILCELAGTEAYLAFSPQHSYIKFKDRNNNWYNIELTQGMLTTDAFVIGSGFINAAAIRNGLYMQPQDKKQVIAHCLSNLASGYVNKYGYDKFVIQCADSVLAYAPGNPTALALRSNYHGLRLQFFADQIGRPPLEVLKGEYPQIYKLFEERNAVYRRMDEIGYVEMPKEVYETWLNSVNEEKEKREHDIRYKNALRLIK